MLLFIPKILDVCIYFLVYDFLFMFLGYCFSNQSHYPIQVFRLQQGLDLWSSKSCRSARFSFVIGYRNWYYGSKGYDSPTSETPHKTGNNWVQVSSPLKVLLWNWTDIIRKIEMFVKNYFLTGGRNQHVSKFVV